MSDGSLSQDEIDALLQETDNLEIDTGGSAAAEPLSEAEKSQLLEMLAGIIVTQSSNFSILTRKAVTLEKPALSLRGREELLKDLPAEIVDVKIDFTDGLRGDHSYLLNAQAAQTIAGLMMGQTGVELDEAGLSAVAEALSQICGSATTELGNQVSRMVKTTPPDYQRIPKAKVRLPQGETIVRLDYPLLIEGETPSTLIELYSLSLVKELLGLARPAAAAGAAAEPAMGAAGPAPSFQAPNQAAAAAMAAFGGTAQTFGQTIGGPSFGVSQAPPNVQPVQFANLQTAAPATEQGNIGLLMDVNMELTVELGRTRKTIREILGIGEGTIIELDKLAGEPVDILVNHKLIAKGEVVVIDENFGVRVTEIVSPMERMSELA